MALNKFNLHNALIHYFCLDQELEYKKGMPCNDDSVVEKTKNDVEAYFLRFFDKESKNLEKALDKHKSNIDIFFKLRILQAACGEKTFDPKIYELMGPIQDDADPIKASLDSLKKIL